LKYIIWGLGAVGTSFLKKIIENGYFNPTLFYCVDPCEIAKKRFIQLGGIDNHFEIGRINKENYLQYLKRLEKDDYLLDFCFDIKNLEILRYCLEKGIHYLNTADSSWNPDPTWISDHQHYLEYVNIQKEFNAEKRNTCIIQFGMNPGLVSSFAKQCLKEIVNKDQSAYIKKHKDKLNKLIKKGLYGLVCKKIGVTDIQEVDNDDQIAITPYEEDTCYSTWNVWSYYYETVSSPEVAFGTKKLYNKYKEVYDCDKKDLYLGLLKSGFEYPAVSYSYQGMVEGHISTHEEIFTMRRLFTHGSYKPTVHFVYSPCEYAKKSVIHFKNEVPKKLHLIQKNEISGGGESVGIIIQGKKFHSRYFGNYLDSKETTESATILQVSASAYSAFVYMLNHTQEGMLFPENINENEVLETAKIYLKDYISVECPKIEIRLGNDKKNFSLLERLSLIVSHVLKKHI